MRSTTRASSSLRREKVIVVEMGVQASKNIRLVLIVTWWLRIHHHSPLDLISRFEIKTLEACSFDHTPWLSDDQENICVENLCLKVAQKEGRPNWDVLFPCWGLWTWNSRNSTLGEESNQYTCSLHHHRNHLCRRQSPPALNLPVDSPPAIKPIAYNYHALEQSNLSIISPPFVQYTWSWAPTCNMSHWDQGVVILKSRRLFPPPTERVLEVVSWCWPCMHSTFLFFQ